MYSVYYDFMEMVNEQDCLILKSVYSNFFILLDYHSNLYYMGNDSYILDLITKNYLI